VNFSSFSPFFLFVFVSLFQHAVKILGYDYPTMTMYFGADPAHAKALNRLAACTFTAAQTYEDLQDPINPDLRADLLIACQDLLNEANRLYDAASQLAWADLDKVQHPSSQHRENPQPN
jgi:hypothetical protein